MALGLQRSATMLAFVLAFAGTPGISEPGPVHFAPRELTNLEAVTAEGLNAGTDRAVLERWGADLLGPAPPSRKMKVQVFFRPSSSAALRAASAVSSPGTALFRHFLTVPQFKARFGAPRDQVQAVDAYFRDFGLKTGTLAPNGLAQVVEGGAGAFSGAFHIPMRLVRPAGDQPVAAGVGAARLPAPLARSVTLVEGLAPWAHMVNDLAWPPHLAPQASLRPASLRPALALPAGEGTGARPACPTPSAQALAPSQLGQLFGLKGFYARGQEGQGENIGLIEYALPDAQAVTTYKSCTGATTTVRYLKAQVQPLLPDPEVATDIQVVASVAPRADIDVYVGSSWGNDLGPWEMAISGQGTARLPQVVSSSWGNCEDGVGLDQSAYTSEEELFEEAAAQGQTVLAASGDSGSEACQAETGSQDLAVDDPASAPYVTAVGGTASDVAGGPQYVWDSRGAPSTACLGTGCKQDGASGGGASQVWPRPAYQRDLPPAPAGVCSQAGGCREVPDVSALSGDPYTIYCSPTICSRAGTGTLGGWWGLTGTSLAAPVWAAAVALSDEECQAGAGFLNPLLYRQPASFVGPVTQGDNDLTGTNHGLYPASSSGTYSMATGLGYLGGVDLSAGQLCGGPPPTGGTPAKASGPSGPSGQGTPTGRPASVCPPVDNVATTAPVKTVGIAVDAGVGCGGYWVGTSNGEVAAFGGAPNFGSLHEKHMRGSIVAMTALPGGGGYWLLSADGGVFAFGHAGFYGSAVSFSHRLSATAIASTPDGHGYWVATAQGRVYAFGDAREYGGRPPPPGTALVTGLAATADGRGYWLATSAGEVEGLGDAHPLGALGKDGKTDGRSGPVVAIVPGPRAESYRLITASGRTYSFGAPGLGGLEAGQQVAPMTAAAGTPGGEGYYLLDSAGHVYAFGHARYGGDVVGTGGARARLRRG